MKQHQFSLIIDTRFPRLDKRTTVSACRAVLFEGLTAYAAERAYGCPPGTVGRYVNKIHAELAFCEEVVNHAKKD
jgi:hypothetical protein